VLLDTFSDREPATYYWVDLSKKTFGLIKKSAPWIEPQRMRPMSIFRYKTREGHAIDAYITLPAGASAKNPPPLVVVPPNLSGFGRDDYRNPQQRSTWGFNPVAQFFASRGYAVLQPNTRGSTGYGWMFPESDRLDLRKNSDDVTASVKALLASGLVDRHRVAIVGISNFSAYLALAGAENEPTLYRCSSVVDGVYDCALLIEDHRIYKNNGPYFDLLVKDFGDPAKEKARFKDLSVLRSAGQLRIPVLAAYGKDLIDYVRQSEELISGLQQSGVHVEARPVGNWRFGFSHLAERVEVFDDIEAFLDRNLASAPASP
jgi:dipeptidyl aminopeptidase/acylaminoacyl peptidase